MIYFLANNKYESQQMLLCIGPEGSGKTLLIKRLLGKEKADEGVPTTVPTVGVNIVTLHHDPELPSVNIRELGMIYYFLSL